MNIRKETYIPGKLDREEVLRPGESLHRLDEMGFVDGSGAFYDARPHMQVQSPDKIILTHRDPYGQIVVHSYEGDEINNLHLTRTTKPYLLYPQGKVEEVKWKPD